MCILRGANGEAASEYLHATRDMNGDNSSGHCTDHPCRWDDTKSEAGSWKNLSKAS